MSTNRKRLMGVAALVAGTALVFCGISFMANMQRELEDAMPDPAPNNDEQAYEDGFPTVDWDYWRSVNPAIVGWITVPGTSIDLPIAQGPSEDPDYYLSHDIYGNRNPNGCPYLDAECADMGLLSRNSVIFAHHTTGGGMFSELAGYSDASFAAEHSQMLLQTPDWKARLSPRMVGVVNASTEPKQTAFADDGEFREWWADKRARATLDIDGENAPARAYSFVTCSYSTWSNERTIIYAANAGGASDL